VALVARSAAMGVMEAVGQVGGNAGTAAKAVVGGAIEAAGTLGLTAVRGVTDLLVGAVEGLKEVAGAVLPKGQAETPGAGEAGPEKKPAARGKSESTSG
jgi:hypothetical protein